MLPKEQLPVAAGVVIVGGGIVGLSIAFHLAERGMTDVVVLERATMASGATAMATGGIRQQFSSEADVLLSLESVHFFREFELRVGYPFTFHQHGYLFLVGQEELMAAMDASVGMQNRLGVPTEVLSAEEIKHRYPMIETSDLIGGAFCPTDGSGAPNDAAYAFSRRAQDLGVRIIEETEVTDIVVEDGRVSAVATKHGQVSTRTVINAAGPWARSIGEMVGYSLPVNPHPRQAFSLTPMEGLGSKFPMTVDLGTGVYIHQEPGSIVVGGGDRDRESSYDAVLDWTRFPSVIAAISHRIPLLEQAGSISGWCGLREMTPDDHAILGPMSTPDGMWNAVGFSGHGFMHAPAVGRIMAEWIVDGAPTGTDVSPFALERFLNERVTDERLVF